MTSDHDREHGVALGHDHVLFFEQWSPDRDFNPQYLGVPDVELFGATIEHPHARTGQVCAGFVTFEGVTQDLVSPRSPKWQVDAWEPLTLSPSVLCSCGDHGYIQRGRWVPA